MCGIARKFLEIRHLIFVNWIHWQSLTWWPWWPWHSLGGFPPPRSRCLWSGCLPVWVSAPRTGSQKTSLCGFCSTEKRRITEMQHIQLKKKARCMPFCMKLLKIKFPLSRSAEKEAKSNHWAACFRKTREACFRKTKEETRTCGLSSFLKDFLHTYFWVTCVSSSFKTWSRTSREERFSSLSSSLTSPFSLGSWMVMSGLLELTISDAASLAPSGALQMTHGFRW